MMSEYNGWKNYETWYVNLHFGDYFQEVYDEYSLEGDYDFIFMPITLKMPLKIYFFMMLDTL